MTFDDLKTELGNRGFSDLTDARRGRYINAARAELDRMFLWPWREKSVTGTPSVTVSDLGPIDSVINTTTDQRLTKVDFQSLLDHYGDLSITGSPWAYYVAWSSGSPAVATYPDTSDTIEIVYWKVTADLSASADTPASPSDAHYLIVDLAVRRAYRDTDNHEAAEAINAEISAQIDALLFTYQPGIADGPDAYVGVTYASEDW